MIRWKQNLFFVWLSQFFSIAGFSLALPFAPFYIQELGITDPVKVKFWVGLSAAAPAVGLAIMSPVWGILSDRFGRKLMMVRANFTAVVVLVAMAFAPTALVFVLLRLAQGFLTGTINAAMTFVASYSPNEKQGMALGAVSTAVFAGAAVGPLVGGFLVESAGYHMTFIFSGLSLFLSALFVLLGVRESFVKPQRVARKKVSGIRARIALLGPGAAILVLLLVSSFARRFDQAFLPLYVQEILGGMTDAASKWTGFVLCAGALGAILAGIVLGRFSDKFSPSVVGKVCAGAGGVFQVLIGLLPGLLLIIPARFFLTLFAAGMDPVFFAWLSRVTPEEQRGTVFGWAVTAKSIGWGITPLVSAAVAVGFGTRTVFLVGGVLFILIIPVICWVARNVEFREHHT